MLGCIMFCVVGGGVVKLVLVGCVFCCYDSFGGGLGLVEIIVI